MCFRLLGYALLLAMPCFAQTSYPMITHCTPIAVQRGTTVEVLVEGQMSFADAHQFLVEGKGVTAKVLAAPPPATTPKGPAVVRSCKLQMTVEPTAELGVREFRLATALGISTLGQLVIVADPVVLEAANNNTIATAQKVTAPSVLSGRIELAEDVDCYRFTAKAGSTMTFEVHCARLQDKIHDLQKHADPLLTLLDETGRELASNDDGTFADPYVTYSFTKDGEYIVQIRDAKYDGDPRWAYALQLTDQPRVAQVFPMAVNPGQVVRLEPTGSAKVFAPQVSFMAPKELGIQPVTLDILGKPTNPTAIVVTPLPLVMEQEPNDAIPQATRILVPGGINGRIQQKRDMDYFIFKGTKGRALRIEVYARRFGTVLTSKLDGMLDILGPTGTVVASNDDANGKDPALVFTPPADGDYVVRLRDLNNKGGEGFAYYLEIDDAKPDFMIKCDPSKAMVGPGSRAAWFVQITRLNGFAGPVTVNVQGLPKSVTVNALTIPPTMTQGVLIATADTNATLEGAMVQIIGTAEVAHDGKPTTLTRRAVSMEEIYFPGGGRGLFSARMQAIAVTNLTDILDVQVTPNQIVLKPGEQVKLAITIKRRPDYDKAVSIDIPLRHLGQIFANTLPPGVTMVDGQSKTLLGTGNVGHITLKCDATAAPIENVPICVLAHVSINFVVKISYASAPLSISIKK